jgi:hypothetical protein
MMAYVHCRLTFQFFCSRSLRLLSIRLLPFVLFPSGRQIAGAPCRRNLSPSCHSNEKTFQLRERRHCQQWSTARSSWRPCSVHSLEWPSGFWGSVAYSLGGCHWLMCTPSSLREPSGPFTRTSHLERNEAESKEKQYRRLKRGTDPNLRTRIAKIYVPFAHPVKSIAWLRKTAQGRRDCYGNS